MASLDDTYHGSTSAFTGGAIALLVVPTVAVIGRLWSRILTSSVGSDDWTCLLALACNLVMGSWVLLWTDLKIDQLISSMPAGDRLEDGLKILFSGYYFFNIGVGLIKTSALLFYGRAFGFHSDIFRTSLRIGHLMVLTWYIFTIVSVSVTCIPVAKNWDRSTPGRCLDPFPFYVVSGLWDTFVDLYILLLPIPIIWKLQMRWGRKIRVATIFLLASCTLVASIGRLLSILRSGPGLNEDTICESYDPRKFFVSRVEEQDSNQSVAGNRVPVLVWTAVEIGLGIVGNCIPSWSQLYTYTRRLHPRPGFSFYSLFDRRA